MILVNTFIFDFDGTLADSSNCSVMSTQRAFEKIGLKIPLAKEIEGYMGIPIEVSFKKMAGDPLSEDKFETLLVNFREIYRSFENQLITTFPDVKVVLNELKNQNKSLYVVTSKHSEVLKRNLQFLGISSYFDGIIGSDNVDHYKPHPDGINKIVEKNGFERDKVMMIGDAIYDIQMAKSATVISCGVTWGTHSEELLRNEKPEYIVHEMKELLKL